VYSSEITRYFIRRFYQTILHWCNWSTPRNTVPIEPVINGNDYPKIRSLRFSLRMLCSHQFLCVDEIPGFTDNRRRVITCSTKFVLLDKLLPRLNMVFIFSQYLLVLDMLDDFL
jgi:hypothetical protein